jgi:protoporphyrinogen oxidase
MATKDGERIVVIGAGPCGLGAAWRLQELGHQNYVVLEAGERPGGLACTLKDEEGFLWDMGE